MKIYSYDHHGFQPKKTLAYNFAIQCNSHTGIFSQQITSFVFLANFEDHSDKELFLYCIKVAQMILIINQGLLLSGVVDPEGTRGGMSPSNRFWDLVSKVNLIPPKVFPCIPLHPLTFSNPPPALFLLYVLGLKTGFTLFSFYATPSNQ